MVIAPKLPRQRTIIQLARPLLIRVFSSTGGSRTSEFSTRLSTPKLSPVSPLTTKDDQDYDNEEKSFHSTATIHNLLNTQIWMFEPIVRIRHCCRLSCHHGRPLASRIVLVAPAFLTHLTLLPDMRDGLFNCSTDKYR